MVDDELNELVKELNRMHKKYLVCEKPFGLSNVKKNARKARKDTDKLGELTRKMKVVLRKKGPSEKLDKLKKDVKQKQEALENFFTVSGRIQRLDGEIHNKLLANISKGEYSKGFEQLRTDIKKLLKPKHYVTPHLSFNDLSYIVAVEQRNQDVSIRPSEVSSMPSALRVDLTRLSYDFQTRKHVFNTLMQLYQEYVDKLDKREPLDEPYIRQLEEDRKAVKQMNVKLQLTRAQIERTVLAGTTPSKELLAQIKDQSKALSQKKKEAEEHLVSFKSDLLARNEIASIQSNMPSVEENNVKFNVGDTAESITIDNYLQRFVESLNQFYNSIEKNVHNVEVLRKLCDSRLADTLEDTQWQNLLAGQDGQIDATKLAGLLTKFTSLTECQKLKEFLKEKSLVNMKSLSVEQANLMLPMGLNDTTKAQLEKKIITYRPQVSTIEKKVPTLEKKLQEDGEERKSDIKPAGAKQSRLSGWGDLKSSLTSLKNHARRIKKSTFSLRRNDKGKPPSSRLH